MWWIIEIALQAHGISHGLPVWMKSWALLAGTLLARSDLRELTRAWRAWQAGEPVAPVRRREWARCGLCTALGLLFWLGVLGDLILY